MNSRRSGRWGREFKSRLPEIKTGTCSMCLRVPVTQMLTNAYREEALVIAASFLFSWVEKRKAPTRGSGGLALLAFTAT